MEMNGIITFIVCICILFFFGKIFIVPIKSILKLVINSVLGGVIILFINAIGTVFQFHIGLNYITAIVIAILGVPGAILLVILKFFIG